MTLSLSRPLARRSMTLSLTLALLTIAGCATGGVTAYVPFERPTTVPVATRWQALERLAEAEKWEMVFVDSGGYSLSAYALDANVPGIRDRIKVRLLNDRTVVEAQSEIETHGGWYASDLHCATYSYAREKALAARIDTGPEPKPPVAAGPARTDSPLSVASAR